MWSWREELNLQPAVYKTAALPLSYASILMILTSYSSTDSRPWGQVFRACSLGDIFQAYLRPV
jgi:hypothetical protein